MNLKPLSIRHACSLSFCKSKLKTHRFSFEYWYVIFLLFSTKPIADSACITLGGRCRYVCVCMLGGMGCACTCVQLWGYYTILLCVSSLFPLVFSPSPSSFIVKRAVVLQLLFVVLSMYVASIFCRCESSCCLTSLVTVLSNACCSSSHSLRKELLFYISYYMSFPLWKQLLSYISCYCPF